MRSMRQGLASCCLRSGWAFYELKMHQNLFYFYEVLFVASAALVPLSSFAGAHANSVALGTCDESSECTVNITHDSSKQNRLCGNDNLSVHWRRGIEQYLIECRGSGTAEENSVFIVDKNRSIFKKLNYGRFVAKRFLRKPVVVIPDRFAPRSLCNPVVKQKLEPSNFVILNKRPNFGGNGFYCYDPIYLTIENGKLLADGAIQRNERADILSPKNVSADEYVSLTVLLRAVRHWELQRFSGTWEWEDAPQARFFSIKLRQRGKQLTGQYCAVAQGGNRIDCDNGGDRNIRGVVNADGVQAMATFSSFFGAEDGAAIISLSGDKIKWRIIKDPVGGDFFAPHEAVMMRAGG